MLLLGMNQLGMVIASHHPTIDYSYEILDGSWGDTKRRHRDKRINIH